MTIYSTSKKNKIKLLLLWITTLPQASIAIYLPSLPTIAQELDITAVQTAQTIALFIIGFGISPLFYGPLSDRYGRKSVLLFSLVLNCVGYLINIFANDLSVFLFARLIQGLGCGGILIGGRSIMRDVFSGRELASASAYLSMGFAIGFGVTPALGGYLSSHFDWRVNFVVLLLITLIIMAVIRALPETYLKKKYRAPFRHFLLNTFFVYQKILSNIQFLKLLVGGVFAYSVILAYNVMSPFLIQETFAWSATQYGYLATLMAAPYFLGAFYNKNLVLKLGVKPIFYIGFILIALAGALILALNLLFTPSALYVIVPMMLAIFGQSLIFSNTIAASLHLFPAKLAGKSSAMFSSLQMLIASGLSAMMALLPHNTAMPIACVIIFLGLGCAALLFNIENE